MAPLSQPPGRPATARRSRVRIHAVLVRSIGVLQTGLGRVIGVLLGGPAIDLLLPAPTSHH